MNENVPLWIIAICVFVQTLISVRNSAFTKKSLQKIENLRTKNPEHEAIRQMINKGNYDEALKMALNLRQKNPVDPYSWYYSGLVYYHTKNWEKAEAELKEAQRMSPTWEEKFTGPYLRAIEEQKGK